MESIFGPVFVNPVTIEYSIINKNWPRFINISAVNFSAKSPLDPYMPFSKNVKPTGVLKLICGHLNLTWENIKKIPSRPLTIITKGPQYAVTGNFANSIQADMDLSHCLSPNCFIDQIVTSCLRLRPWFGLAHTEISGGASFALLTFGIKVLVCFYFISRYMRLWTLLSLAWSLYRINAAWSLWTWVPLFTVFSSSSRRFDFYSPSSRSRRIDFGHWCTNNFI